MKLSIFGDIDKAQKFEKEVELVIQLQRQLDFASKVDIASSKRDSTQGKEII